MRENRLLATCNMPGFGCAEPLGVEEEVVQLDTDMPLAASLPEDEDLGRLFPEALTQGQPENPKAFCKSMQEHNLILLFGLHAERRKTARRSSSPEGKRQHPVPMIL